MSGAPHEPGVISLALEQIFTETRKNQSREFLIRISYIEIYNEIISDLLRPDHSNLQIHEDPVKGFFVSDVTEMMVTTKKEVEALLLEGASRRHVGETGMNDASSCSHSIFRMVVESRTKFADDEDEGDHSIMGEGEEEETEESEEAVRVSVLNLVDLAGSERVKHTKAEGLRLVEGGHINRSLLTLGSVINKLAENASHVHVPFRDSSLTKILPPELGGKSNNAVVCTITP
eukprot:TRINITY_DN11988_c0_g1_i1.p1 TRINITY_DN11988_c0_g1~~TRINITY_DN11988_c0_g1_i1.p1  ORF type:complete len:232 (-),score=44.53 TRINITY_DN11988_c0_g1_i1:197-892(-)